MLFYLDGTYSQVSVTGLSRYSDNVLAAIDRHPKILNGKHRGVVFGYRSAGDFRIPLKNLGKDLVPLSMRFHLYGNTLLEYPDISKWFKQQPDIVHYHDVFRFTHDLPRTKTLVTVHDLSSIVTPGYYSLRSRFMKMRALERIQKNFAKIVCVSENTRRDLLKLYPMDEKRVSVIHLGVDSVFSNAKTSGFAYSNLFQERKYVLFVGRYHRRKNIEGIIRTFHLLDFNFPIALCLVGHDIQDAIVGTDEFRALPEHVKGRIHFLGSVSDDALSNLYHHALCLIYPSQHEGFGLPVIEAMASGCPVISSQSGSLYEVAGGAAIFREPNDYSGMAKAIADLYLDADLFNTYRVRGLDKSQLYTWDAVADKTIRSYEEMILE